RARTSRRTEANPGGRWGRWASTRSASRARRQAGQWATTGAWPDSRSRSDRGGDLCSAGSLGPDRGRAIDRRCPCLLLRLQVLIEPVGERLHILDHLGPAVPGTLLDHELRLDAGPLEALDEALRLLEGH